MGKLAAAIQTSVADALFTTTQQRVLGLLFGHPDRSYFASELIALTGSGSGAVQREVARLVGSGLAVSKIIGRQRHYQANLDSPVYEELRGIVAKTEGLPDALRSALDPLAARITLALIYGSIAKGTATAASDVDLLVVSDQLMLEDLYVHLADAESVVHRKVNPTLYTIREFQLRLRKGNAFLTKLLDGPLIPLIGVVGDTAAAR
jgi:predicted nucleotidyltransferase